MSKSKLNHFFWKIKANLHSTGHYYSFKTDYIIIDLPITGSWVWIRGSKVIYVCNVCAKLEVFLECFSSTTRMKKILSGNRQTTWTQGVSLSGKPCILHPVSMCVDSRSWIPGYLGDVTSNQGPHSLSLNLKRSD